MTCDRVGLPISIRTVLVPLDGSRIAESAVELVIPLARCLGAQIVLLRAALAQTTTGTSPGCAQREVSRVVADARQYLGAVEQRLRTERANCRSVVPYGPSADSVIANAELQGADLVVMSAHGTSGPSRWNHGGVADKIVQGLSRPVLLIQGQSEPAAGSRILVPLDGSELAEIVLDQVADLSRCLQRGITLLTVVSSDAASGPFRWQSGIADESGDSSPTEAAATYLREIADRLRRRGLDVVHEIREGAPPDEILRRAARDDVSLVIISAHGLSGIGRWVYGGVATKVLHQSIRPVLLFRSPEARQRSTEQSATRRCHNCGRTVYRDLIAALDVCPLCGFPLRVCVNCSHFDGVVCEMDNPWDGGIYAHNPCLDFQFRETTRAAGAVRGR